MGNQLLKGYTIQGEPISAVGCQRMWRIYQGTKQSTGTNATIFAIQKKALPKGDKEQLIQFAKRQAMGLARIRHPGVLAISQTLIQDEHVMAFSTQQILGNLTILSRDNKLKQIISNQIQLRLNLFPLLDTLQFLHQNVKTVHLGLNFDNIYITKQGKWKISGFSNSQIYGGQGLEDLKNFKCTNFYFCAPEIANQKKFQKKSDVYSLGILILDLLLVLVGKYQVKNYRSQSEYKQSFQKDLMKKINNEALQKLQNFRQLKNLLKAVFAREVQKRANLQQLISSKWLNDKLVLTVRYLQNITSYDNKQQIQFLKGLMGILNHFQPRILLRKVLPLLLDLLKFKHLIPSVIYICLQIMKNGKIITQNDFKERVWPFLRKVVQGKQMTAHSLYLFVENMQKIEKAVGIQQLTNFILPLYIKCFDCPQKLKQLALMKTDYVLNKMDYQFVKTKMIPKIMSCIKDQSTDVHKKSLIALRKSIKILDTQTITSIVLPGLETARKSGSDPYVNAITVSIYTMLGKTLPSQILCAKLIPTVLPYLSDPNVGPQDFYSYKNAMMTMIDKIESERKKFWDESQISQGQGYTQKDFQFQDQSKKAAVPQSNLGKGDYNFLSNYNNGNQNLRNQQPMSPNTTNMQVKRQTNNQNFDFSSPFNFDEAIKSQSHSQPQAQSYQNQYQPQQTKSNTMASFSNPTSSPSYGLPINSQSKNQPQLNTNTNTSSSTGGYGDFNFGDMGFGKPQISSPQKMQSPVVNTQQGGYQQNKQNFPKLKGPNQASKPQYKQQKLDPWASISMSETYTNTNTNMNMNANTSNYNYNQNNFSAGFGNMGGLGNINIGDDPFADIQSKNNSNNYGNANQNTNTNLNMNSGINNNMNFGIGSFNTNTNSHNNNNSFGYGNSWDTSQTFNMNSGTGNTTNMNSLNIGNNNAFSFDLNITNTQPTNKQNSGFGDLI